MKVVKLKLELSDNEFLMLEEIKKMWDQSTSEVIIAALKGFYKDLNEIRGF